MGERISPLLLRNSIKPSYLVLPHEKRFYGLPLLYFLYMHSPFVGEDNWRRWFSNGPVAGTDGVPLNKNTLLRAGEVMYYYRETSHDNEPRTPFDEKVLHAGEHLIVVGRPHFLPVTPSSRFLHETLLTHLRLYLELQHLDVGGTTSVHRLGKDTVDTMLLPHNPAVHCHYQTISQDKAVRKTHKALASMRTDLRYPHRISPRLMRSERFFLTQEADGESNTHTAIELFENRGDTGLYRLYPRTGKEHQLCIHMTSLGISTLSDTYYPVPSDAEEDCGKPLKLLAKGIEFQDPISGMMGWFESMQTLWTYHHVL